MPRTAKKEKHLVAAAPVKPDNLSDRAAREWDRIAGELEAAHILLSPAHRSLLELAATISADIAECLERIVTDGEYIVTKAGLVAHPASKRKDALRRDYIKAAATLGLRSATAGPVPSKDKTLEDILDEQ